MLHFTLHFKTKIDYKVKILFYHFICNEAISWTLWTIKKKEEGEGEGDKGRGKEKKKEQGKLVDIDILQYTKCKCLKPSSIPHINMGTSDAAECFCVQTQS